MVPSQLGDLKAYVHENGSGEVTQVKGILKCQDAGLQSVFSLCMSSLTQTRLQPYSCTTLQHGKNPAMQPWRAYQVSLHGVSDISRRLWKSSRYPIVALSMLIVQHYRNAGSLARIYFRSPSTPSLFFPSVFICGRFSPP